MSHLGHHRGVAPPREPGFQNAIEGFNGLWQSKVWQRHRFPDVATLKSISARYIAAYRAKTAGRREDRTEPACVPTASGSI